MKCSFCGHKFKESEALSACGSCGFMKKCDLLKCPNCQFEIVPEPEWIKKIRTIRRS